MKLDLTDKSALITGASKGIGLAVAQVLAHEGCDVHLAARNGEAMQAAKTAIEAETGRKVTVHVADLGSTPAMEALAIAAGPVDILVNNAGDIPAGPLDVVDDAAWRKGFDLKVFGYITLSRLLYPQMRGRDGVIVNVIGNSGENWDASYIAGSTGNAALMAFTKALGGASLNEGVRVVGVNPGPVATDRMLKIMKRKAIDMLGSEDRWQELFDKYPGKRPATSEEVADLVAFLASPRAGYITGTIVTIDGGIAARGSVI
ncbi:NAD(P)-dependent dehydrogenase, short-chain alcohol dehydrogenase family [Enhydrobacter aerosaccus]|uniref:NAD(P)-dependent dehydrogenase, short-chain alcohol dehydrogenase family n=1 Tax=Enhydrobacter aerosaccus TaxID=225324 RepID=A0A1T4JQH1_9HYPH|nr:SDR family oxidoreductase [Enhydrobacter aerosaccus]SJZ32404.1 NAD(P)-dependent dehydrogenase, short-chain alcohol dehydrogenase family [Enhydrobacter aerosaccus]